MTDLKRLLEQAPPLPWGDPEDVHYGDFGWYISGSPLGETDDTEEGRAAMSLATHAVNRLPDYEAAVDALREMVEAGEESWPLNRPVLANARAALTRLRE